MILSCRSVLKMRNVSDKIADKIETHFMVNKFFFFSKIVLVII
jgi:hypothetical protein